MASVHFGRLLGGAGFSRTVAIKRLHPHLAEDPEFRSTMIDEARLAARIHHPNVVPTLDVVASDGALLLVMEYVRGESLARLMKIEVARGGRVPLPIASAIAIGALHGLHAAHEARSDRGTALGIVHRDVSPQNILVGIDGMPRVIDFGVAKAAGRLQTTREGVVKGKVAYMAPEQIAGTAITRQADVYAMAVMLWEMLAGQRLFTAESDAALFFKVMKGATDPPSHYTPNLPAELDALVMTGLSLDPADRFASARDMAEMLKAIVPPAFPTDVGAWVEEVAGVALTKRESLLEEIESSSGMTPLLPPPSARSLSDGDSSAVREAHRPDAVSEHSTPSRPSLPTDDAPTLATHPSTLGVERPPSMPAAPPSRRGSTKVVGALLFVCATLGVAVAALLWRGATTHDPAAAGPAVGDTTEWVAPKSPSPPVSASGEPAIAAAPPVAIPSTTPGPAVPIARPVVAPAKPFGKPPPTAKSAAPFRFAQPD
jgi:serine/threonine-protein kinase